MPCDSDGASAYGHSSGSDSVIVKSYKDIIKDSRKQREARQCDNRWVILLVASRASSYSSLDRDRGGVYDLGVAIWRRRKILQIKLARTVAS